MQHAPVAAHHPQSSQDSMTDAGQVQQAKRSLWTSVVSSIFFFSGGPGADGGARQAEGHTQGHLLAARQAASRVLCNTQ